MKDEQKRFGKGFAVALAVHLVLAAGLGIFGYRFVHTPPEILEVSLESGGGGAEAQEEEIEQEEQQEEPVIQSLEDIIDQKLKPKPQKKVVRKKATAAPGPKAPAGNPTGNGTGTGTDSGTGSGSGSGNGCACISCVRTQQRCYRCGNGTYSGRCRRQCRGCNGSRFLRQQRYG